MTSDKPDADNRSGRAALIALVVIVTLALGAAWLAQQLRAANQTQDCVMAGRTNCAPIR